MSRRILIPLLLGALIVPFAMAQDNSGQQQQREGDRGRGGPGGGGNFDPAAMRQRAMERFKEQMGVTNEDEWKVIQAKLDPVMTKRMETFGGFGRGFGRSGRGGDNNERAARNPVEQASNDLRKVLDDKAASEDSIKQKLAAYREARDKSRTELAAAQKELKEILMPRQEAVLVQASLLD